MFNFYSPFLFFSQPNNNASLEIVELDLELTFAAAMNAVTNSANDFIPENAGGSGSDSDANTDEESPPEYYQPISAVADEDEELHFSDPQNDEQDHQFNSFHHPLPNGYALHSLDLNVDDDDDDSEEEEEEEEGTRRESDVAVQRAFRNDESRRNAALTPENSVRVMEAMRGVSFGGLAPDWVGQIPEDQWIDQLRRIRRPSPASSAALE